MELPNYFTKFLREIRLTDNQKEDLRKGHSTLRERLRGYDDLKNIIVSTFLQGSYRRATAVRPKGDTRADVDIVVVTKLKTSDYPNPDKAMDLFEPFLEKYYKGKYRRQGRSFGIELSYVDLDLVITAAPSEAEENIYKSNSVITEDSVEDAPDWRFVASWVPGKERLSAHGQLLMEKASKESEWKTEPLLIPDREAKCWDPTHPLEQIKWTYGKNARCERQYVNVVKAIKWWQRVNYDDDKVKSYPLEHIIGDKCPDFIKSVAVGVTSTFASIVKTYELDVINKQVPNLSDRGVPEHNVLKRISVEDFIKFYEHCISALKIASEALGADNVGDSAKKWRELFGDKFPPPADDDKGEQSKGPFIIPPAKSQTGDITPRRYGFST